MNLGVNIDHIAVLREARKMNEPNPLDAVGICQKGGADQITIHLREDRRHIQDEDAKAIIEQSLLPINLECALADDIIDFVCQNRPFRATIVPEKRQEVTTEGGLDLEANYNRLKEVIKRLQSQEIEVSLFIDANPNSILLAKELGANWIEFHTGYYANLWAMLYSNLSRTHNKIASLESLTKRELKLKLDRELETIAHLAKEAKAIGLMVASGHGLNYQNVTPIAQIDAISELNIGQSIIARSIFVGLKRAILDMRELIDRARVKAK